MIYLDDKDIVRHKLVKKIVDAYKKAEDRPDAMSDKEIKKVEN